MRNVTAYNRVEQKRMRAIRRKGKVPTFLPQCTFNYKRLPLEYPEAVSFFAGY